MSNKVMKWVNTGAFLSMIVVNALANLLPLGGKTTGQIAEGYSNLFSPAPITFIIWGLINLVMLIFLIKQWGIGVFKESGPKYLEAIGPWFAISCLFNIGWIFSWHFEVIWLSVVLIFGLLLSLIMTEIRISSITDSGFSRFLTVGGFDLYLGWILAATIVNVCVYWSGFDGNGLFYNNLFQTMIAIAVATLVAIMMELLYSKWISVSVILWAFVGILIRHVSPNRLDGEYMTVILSVMVCIFLILLTMIFQCFRKNCTFRKKDL